MSGHPQRSKKPEKEAELNKMPKKLLKKTKKGQLKVEQIQKIKC